MSNQIRKSPEFWILAAVALWAIWLLAKEAVLFLSMAAK